MDREKTGVYYDVFWGKITAYDGSTYYSWTEQQLLPGPTSQDMAGGRAGTLTAGPAYEPNCNFLLNGSLVLITRVYYDPTLDWVYAAVAGAQQSTSCAGSGSGSGSGSGASSAWYCLNAPAGGGGGHDSPCNLWPYGDCSGGGFEAGIIWGVGCSHDTPNKLYATFTDAPAALAALGIVPLCYDADTGGWDANPSSILFPYNAKCLVGPGGTITLGIGTWIVYQKTTDNPEIPFDIVGQLQIS